VDGTLVEAWASHKSFRPKGADRGDDDGDSGNPTVNFRGEKRSNETHESTTDPDARLARSKTRVLPGATPSSIASAASRSA